MVQRNLEEYRCSTFNPELKPGHRSAERWKPEAEHEANVWTKGNKTGTSKVGPISETQK